MSSPLLVLGTRTLAVEVADLAGEAGFEVAGFVENMEPERCCEELEGLPLAASAAGLRAKLMFSAKEAAYKALWPSLRHFLDFHDIEVRIDLYAGRFAVISHTERCPGESEAQLEGRFLEVSGLFATGVALRSG